jgi:hypothetical protein
MTCIPLCWQRNKIRTQVFNLIFERPPRQALNVMPSIDKSFDDGYEGIEVAFNRFCEYKDVTHEISSRCLGQVDESSVLTVIFMLSLRPDQRSRTFNN